MPRPGATTTGEPRRLRATADALKQLILDRQLQPGDPLPSEAELTTMLDVSRSNLREAIRTLVAIDILEVRHGTGTFIGPMTLRPLVNGLTFKGLLMPGEDFDTLRQVIEMRRVLDLGLAPRIVKRLHGQTRSPLHTICDEMDAAVGHHDRFAEADRDFHLAIAGQTGNELYVQLVGAFWDVHRIVSPRLGIQATRDQVDTAGSHRSLLDAAVAGDLERYSQAIDEHYAPLMRVLGMPSTE